MRKLFGILTLAALLSACSSPMAYDDGDPPPDCNPDVEDCGTVTSGS